jgi:ATP-dependent DNA ligase
LLSIVIADLVFRGRPTISCSRSYSHLSVEEDGAIVFRRACKLGCEGIVSKRLGSPYRSGRSAHWVKVKNPKALVAFGAFCFKRASAGGSVGEQPRIQPSVSWIAKSSFEPVSTSMG